jgi:DNA-directed RNA polymerase specialized sigma24 family protein
MSNRFAESGRADSQETVAKRTGPSPGGAASGAPKRRLFALEDVATIVFRCRPVWDRFIGRNLTPRLRIVLETEDVLQEALLEIVRRGKVPTARDEAQVVRWFQVVVLRILAHQVRFYTRHCRESGCTIPLEFDRETNGDEKIHEPEAPWGQPDFWLMSEEDLTAILSVILSLPERCSRLVVLVDLEEVPLAIAAAELHFDLVYASTTLYRSRKWVAEELERMGMAPESWVRARRNDKDARPGAKTSTPAASPEVETGTSQIRLRDSRI